MYIGSVTLCALSVSKDKFFSVDSFRKDGCVESFCGGFSCYVWDMSQGLLRHFLHLHTKKHYQYFLVYPAGEKGHLLLSASVTAKPQSELSTSFGHLRVYWWGLSVPPRPLTFACLLVVHTPPVEELQGVLPATSDVSGQGTDFLLVCLVFLPSS